MVYFPTAQNLLINRSVLMNKQEIYEYLTASGISFEVTEHEAVYTMEELAQIPLAHPEAEAKNLFVRDDKKQHYYLLTVPGEKRVDLKVFQKQNGLRKLSFGSSEDLLALLQLTPGGVTPLGLLNDEDHKVELYLDSAFRDRLICVHPNENTASLCLQSGDLVALLTQRGCTVHWVEV
jgi:Ala-tRNA(Pro) deacylase